MRINSPRGDLANQLYQSFANQHVNTTQTQIKEIASNLPEIQSNLKKVSSCGDLRALQPTMSLRELLDAAKEKIEHITADFSIYTEILGVGLDNLTRKEEPHNRLPSERLCMIEEHLQHLSQEQEYLSERQDTLNTIAEDLNKEGLLTKEIASSLEIANEEYKKATDKLDQLVTIYEEKRQLLAPCQNQSKTPLHYSFNTLPFMHANVKANSSGYLGIETSSEKVETSEADKKISSVAKNVFSHLGVQFAHKPKS